MTETLPPQFETAHYRIFPYARGVGYPPDLMYAVYKAMEPDLERIFYDMQYRDLQGVLRYFLEAILYVVASPDLTQVLGAVWFTDIKFYQGSVGVWFAPALRGKAAIAATVAVVDYAMRQYNWRHILGFTPWKEALNHALSCGFHMEHAFENMIEIQGLWRPLYVVRRQRTALHALSG